MFGELTTDSCAQPGATREQVLAGVAVGGDDCHCVVAGCEFVGGARAYPDDADSVRQCDHAGHIGRGDLSLAVADGDVRRDAE